MPANVVLRPLTAAHQAFLWTALYHAIYVAPGDPPLPPEIVHLPDIAPYTADFGRAGDRGVIATAGDQPIGAAWARRMRGYGYVDDDTPELSIALLPGWRGAGIGSLLLERLLGELSADAAQVSLSVVWTNPARRLYERLGFETVALEGGSATMVKRLLPASKT